MNTTYSYCLLCALLYLASCSVSETSKPFEFPAVECTPDPTPGYDFNFMTLLDSLGNPAGELVDSIRKTRRVFKPCRIMTYRAVWTSDDGKVITNSQIRMMATGKRWEMQPEKQDEILVQYAFDEADSIISSEYQLNKGILDRWWMEKGIEGVVENEDEIWMHPFRFNQYNFTEVAPFPEVKLPLEVGKKWSGNLNIMNGWGDWDNSKGNMSYEVQTREAIETRYSRIENCWKITSKSKYNFGESYLDFWFSEELGFVRMEYNNYGDQQLVIELENISE